MADRLPAPRAAKTADGKEYWFVQDPNVPGPYGVGDTPEAALEDLREAIGFWKPYRDRQGQTQTIGSIDGGARVTRVDSSLPEGWTLGTEPEKVSA